MEAVDAVKVLARRWYVVVAGVLVVAVAAVATMLLVPTAYQASGQLLILLPVSSTGVATPTNPYLNAPAGLTTTASLLAGNVATEDVKRSLSSAGFDSDYAASVVPGAGPLIVVTASGTDPADVRATRDQVMVLLDDQLARIQREVEVPPSQVMFTSASAVTRDAEALPGSRLRALIGVVAAGGVLVLGLTFGLDRLLAARRRRRPSAVPATGLVRDVGTTPTPVVVPPRRGDVPVAVLPAQHDGAACAARP